MMGGLFTMLGGEGAGSRPSGRKRQSSDLINQCMFLPRLLKGKRGGSVCLSVEEAGTAGRTERGKGGVAGGTLDLPQTIWRMGSSTMVKALGG